MGCDAKREAARGFVEAFGDAVREAGVVGVGTGSTVARVVEELHARGMLEGKVLVASSYATLRLLSRLGYNHVLLPHYSPAPDVYFDGADEVDPQGRLVKGRGGAMLGEKVLAARSRTRVYVVDESKLVDRLGERRPVPLDVSPPALRAVLEAVEAMGFNARVREAASKDGPSVSDWGGIIVDVHTGPLDEPERVEVELESLPGVAASGLFTRYRGPVVVGVAGCGYKVMEPA